MKKAIIAILIVTMLYNVLLPTHFYEIHAGSIAPQDDHRLYQDNNEFYEGLNMTIDDSKILFDGEKRDIETPISQGGAGTTIVFDIINVIPIVCNTLLSIAAYPLDNEGATAGASDTDVNSIKRWFSIQDTVFGKISIFDINYSRQNGSTPRKNTLNSSSADTNSTEAITPGDEKETEDQGTEITNSIKSNVAIWYMAVRNLVIALLLLVLIYVGIRMATSSIAQQRARYKKMLLNWLASMLIVFLLHYIIFFTIGLSDGLVKIISGVGGVVSDESNLEQELIAGDQTKDSEHLFQNENLIIARTGLIQALNNTNGWGLVYISIVYWVLVYYQIKFFFLYLKRFLTVGFLIVISPLIAVTYSIDKIGDGRAQAFNAWIKEFMVNVFIQPLHAMLYLVFMTTAFQIAYIAPILAVLFLSALSQGEKIVRKLLNIDGLTSIKTMSETAGFRLFKHK